jgi:hypothetical protein
LYENQYFACCLCHSSSLFKAEIYAEYWPLFIWSLPQHCYHLYTESLSALHGFSGNKPNHLVIIMIRCQVCDI